MDYLLTGTSVLLSVVFATTMWLLFCNSRTLSQRMKILDECSRNAKLAIDDGYLDWMQYYKPFETVTYDQHLFYLCTLRNPKKLYEEMK